jgi:hypothetical protein
MDDACTYFIQLRGQVAADEINTRSPLLLTLIDADPASTCLTVTTDQAGLIGLLRHLHGAGFVLLSVNRATRSGEPPC